MAYKKEPGARLKEILLPANKGLIEILLSLVCKVIL